MDRLRLPLLWLAEALPMAYYARWWIAWTAEPDWFTSAIYGLFLRLQPLKRSGEDAW